MFHRYVTHHQQLVLKPTSLADVLNDIMLIADAIGEHDRGVKLLHLLESRLLFVKVRNVTKQIEQETRLVLCASFAFLSLSV
jgi:hypothetical protein